VNKYWWIVIDCSLAYNLLNTLQIIMEMIFPVNPTTGAKTVLSNQSFGCY